jgi:hypothetical protein
MITLHSGLRLTVKNTANLVKPGMGQRMRTGSATKGARDYHWAIIEVTPGDTPEDHDDGHAFLLLRKHRYTETVSYFLCWSPVPVPLAKLTTALLELIPVAIPELLRQLRGTVIPTPAATRPTATPGHDGADATNTRPGKPTSARTPTPTRCHDNQLQLPY